MTDQEIEKTIMPINQYIKYLNETIDKENFGNWNVNEKGDLYNKKYDYFIHHKRLKENWIRQINGKIWRDMNDFIDAYFQACKNAKIKEICLKFKE